MYAGRLACPLVSHRKYADGTDRRTDGRQTVTLRFRLSAMDAGRRNNNTKRQRSVSHYVLRFSQ